MGKTHPLRANLMQNGTLMPILERRLNEITKVCVVQHKPHEVYGAVVGVHDHYR